MTRWLVALLVVFLGLAAPKWILGWQYGRRIYPVEQAPVRAVAIVFGAGLRRDGKPTTVLADRVDTAVDLFREGKIDGLLMTGSQRDGYDEPAAMAARARALGVPPEAILVDTGGVRTYESCSQAYRAGIRSALLVSQRFHLPRALALCDSMGIQADGVAADRSFYGARARRWWALREYPASLVALIETWFARPGQATPA
jgi:vancomycin permeability regulator SanA